VTAYATSILLEGRARFLGGRGAAVAVGLLLLIGLAYWLWFGLAQRTINEDDGISILAAQGILDHGIPRLESGFIYDRGLIPHYLLAASIGSLGLNDLGIMMPSLIFGLGSLWLVYLFARDVLGRRWVGVAAIALLLMLQTQAIYATGPRMYMSLQFFTMLAAYSGWRGYVQGSRPFQLVTLLAIAAAMLSQKQGAALVVAIPLAVLMVTWINRQRIPSVLSVWNLAGVILVVLAGLFLFVYEIPDAMQQIAFHGGLKQDHVGLFLNPNQWTSLAFQSQVVFPFGLSFLPIAVFLAAKAFFWRQPDPHLGLTYVLLLFAAGGLAVLIFVNFAEARFWFFILPFNAVIVCASVAALLEHLGSTPKKWFRRNFAGSVVLILLLAGGVAANSGFVFAERGANGVKRLVAMGYGPPCMESYQTRSWPWCSDQESRYATLRQEVAPGDLLISSNPWLTNYYLGRVDGLLREKRGRDGSFTSFDYPKEEYFGIPIIDTLDELLQLAEGDQRVWVIEDPKVVYYSSEKTRRFVDGTYVRRYEDKVLATYVNCLEPPCDLYSEDSDLARLKGYNEAVRLNPGDAQAYYNRAIAYHGLGLHQRAISDYDEALRLKPKSAYAYNQRSVAHYKLGDLETALDDLNEAVRLDPQFAEAYNNRAMVYDKLGEFQLALYDLDEAVRLDPQLPEAYLNRATVHIKLGEPQAAVADLNQAVQLDPQFAGAYGDRAMVNTLLGRDTAAQEDYEQAVELGLDATGLARNIERIKQQR